jgi:hypothetical protein
MVRLAFGFEGEETERYLAALNGRVQQAEGSKGLQYGAISGI